jgi:glycosyltransferase involved in cell wall biosynthesis
MISILCSNYNSSEWIHNYCNYINSQLLHSFEVIFVDANSTDDSLSKIQNFSFRDGIKVTIVPLSERVTVYEAWNIAIDKSSNDYVMNYNTDDKLFGSALLSLVGYINQYPHIDVLYSNCLVSQDVNHSSIQYMHDWGDANDMQTLLKGCCCGPFPLLRKQKVIDCGKFNPVFSISGDYEMWCRMNSKGAIFKKIDECLGVYYHNPNGVSTKNDPERSHLQLGQDLHLREIYSRTT